MHHTWIICLGLLATMVTAEERHTAVPGYVEVSSVKALRDTMVKSNQRVFMEPGTYVVSDENTVTSHGPVKDYGTNNSVKPTEPLIKGQGNAQHYPAFSWETVPVGFHFGKTDSLMTAEEARFVASHASFICLEKGHATRQFKTTEEGIEQEAQQLKKYNPNMIVIFFWNTFLDYSIYNWGYRMENGCLEWYPEFDRQLGEPAGAMVKEDWTLSREFEHASVWVNLETREADIKWQ